MKPWPLKPAATQSAVGDLVDDRLGVRRHVVVALDDRRERIGSHRRYEVSEPVAHRMPPPLVRRGLRLPGGAQVAREQASVGELLRGDAAVDRDHERIEQRSLRGSPRNRKRGSRTIGSERSERCDETRGVVGRRDDDGVGGARAAVAHDAPAGAVAARARARGPLERRTEPCRGVGERRDDRLRPVEVAVLGAVRAAHDAVGIQSGHELPSSAGVRSCDGTPASRCTDTLAASCASVSSWSATNT